MSDDGDDDDDEIASGFTGSMWNALIYNDQISKSGSGIFSLLEMNFTVKKESTFQTQNHVTMQKKKRRFLALP